MCSQVLYENKMIPYLHYKESTNFFRLLCIYKEHIEKLNRTENNNLPHNSHNTALCSCVLIAIVSKETCKSNSLCVREAVIHIGKYSKKR